MTAITWIKGDPRATLRAVAAAGRAQGLRGLELLEWCAAQIDQIGAGRPGVQALRRRLKRMIGYLSDPQRELARSLRLSPYGVDVYSPKLRGGAAEYGRFYVGVRVVDRRWYRRHTGIGIIVELGSAYDGGPRSQGYQLRRLAHNIADAMNALHRHQRGYRSLTVQDVLDCEDAELQRRMIEAWPGGWAAWLDAAGAREVRRDRYGILVDIQSAAGPIRAVRVTCPTTGRQYALRVPPAIETAHAAVAWTFGMEAEEYHPTIQF
jgi:hypothetical protein